MILTGTNYNIRNPSDEIRRLKGSDIYNESRAKHFSNLYNRTSGGGLYEEYNPDRFSQLEQIERVDAVESRPRIYNKTVANTKRAVSGRSTQGIRSQRNKEPAIDARIVLANTKRQTKLTQKLLP